MKKLSTYFLGAALLVFAAGCSKSSDPTPATPTLSAKTVLLTTPKWRITAIVTTVDCAGQTTTSDSYTNQPDCQKDDFTKFNTDRTGVVDEGLTKCPSGAAQTRNATWSFNTAETTITTVDPSIPAVSAGSTIVADLLELTSTTLQVRTRKTQVSGSFAMVSTTITTYAAF